MLATHRAHIEDWSGCAEEQADLSFGRRCQLIPSTGHRLIYPFYLSSAFYFCCIYSRALRLDLLIEANTMSPDQTAPYGAV